jgi:hypothetical protein
MKFELIHILGVMTIAAIFIVGAVTLLGPTFKLAAEIRLKKDRVLHQLDHSKIAVAAIELLASAPNGLLEDADIPPAIKDGEPKFVNIAYECVTIEYGGGFAHYGLIIDPTGRTT